jgi:multiple sugar transport system permease protein/sn-glycerol 3-phosphate transport system permease protein
LTPLSARKRHDYLTALLFLLPSLIIFGVFIYYALAFNVYLSATSWNFISPTKNFVGLDNYTAMFSDPRFWNVVGNTVYFSVGSVALSVVLGLFLAVLLYQKLPARGIFRTIFFSPYITTTAAIALLWVWIFDPNYGLANFFLGIVGIDGPRWLTSTTWAMPALIIMNVWKTVGYAMVIFFAGLTDIPSQLYEAAEIDGANGRQTFFRITLPLLSPTTFFIIVTSLLNAFQVFDQVSVMTLGGPADATNVFNFYIFQQAFINFKAGYAAAVSTVFFLILLAITVFQLRASRRWVHYQ